MRGLTAEERRFLEVDSEWREGDAGSGEAAELVHRLVARGLLHERHEEDEENWYTFYDLTELGRLALRLDAIAKGQMGLG